MDISKGGNRFANWRFMEQEGTRLMAELAREHWLAGLSADRFAERMVWYMGELNVPHPFRDDHGRALREYMRYLAEQTGHPLTWEDVPPDPPLPAPPRQVQGQSHKGRRVVNIPDPNAVWRDLQRSGVISRSAGK